jgi:glycosyltransferase involved in cell wall biosynthesis
MAKRPLCVLHSESSPSLGGQELRILTEMEALAGRGIRSVLVARPDSAILRQAQRRHLDAHGIAMRNSFDLPSQWQLLRLFKHHGVDVANSHNSKDAWNVAVVARLLGKPVLRSRHIANPLKPGRLRLMIYGPMCDAILTTGEGIKAGMVDFGIPQGKIHVVPTGIDMARYAGAAPGSLRTDLGIPAGAPLVAQVAVMRSDKGPDVFVRAAQKLIARGCPAYFVLVGEGRMRQRVETLIQQDGGAERIKLAGFRRDVPEILADIDLYVLAARSPEGVPQAVLQAHAARVPVVATRVRGVDEAAIHGETALCAPRNDSDELATLISHLLSHPEEGARLAERGYQLTAERYTLDRMLDRMEALYRQLAG